MTAQAYNGAEDTTFKTILAVVIARLARDAHDPADFLAEMRRDALEAAQGLIFPRPISSSAVEAAKTAVGLQIAAFFSGLVLTEETIKK